MKNKILGSVFLFLVMISLGCEKQEFVSIGGCQFRPDTTCVGDYSGQNLSGLDLRGGHFVESRFDTARFVDSLMQRTDLRRSSFRGAVLDGANLNGANLTGADLEGASMKGTITSAVLWSDTVCPDGINSDQRGGSCVTPVECEVCAERPAFCDGDTLVTDTGPGISTDLCGCDYRQVEHRADCPSNTLCDQGICQELCLDEDCPEVPPSCDGNTRVVHGQGLCSADTGQCEAQVVDLIDCEEEGLGCLDGLCADLCNGVDCLRPPDHCDGEVAHRFEGGGGCGSMNGQCLTPVREAITDCTDTGRVCRFGQCVTASCDNGRLDADEDDIDCGGFCLKCRQGQQCISPMDCESGLCVHGRCEAEFKQVARGTFLMGAPPDEPGAFSDEVQHEVTLSRGFVIQTTEATEDQWNALMDSEAASTTSCGLSCPLIKVSWYEALAFANAMSLRDGLPECFTLLGCEGEVGLDLVCQDVRVEAPGGDPYQCRGYRLPTEAEWEYAARGRTQTPYFSGESSAVDCEYDPNLDLVGWYCGNAEGLKEVGLKEPNNYGLYDMHGNINEWTFDLYRNDYENLPGLDPVNLVTGDGRTNRGGDWSAAALSSRSAFRGLVFSSNSKFLTVGFRLARTVQ